MSGTSMLGRSSLNGRPTSVGKILKVHHLQVAIAQLFVQRSQLFIR